MKGPTAEEKRQALAAFVDTSEPVPTVTLDRSTLERWSTCPAQAAFVASGKVNNNSLAAAAGEEVHQALSKTLADYIAQFESTGTYPTPREMRNELEQYILGSRPDVQPQAIAGLKASMWAWVDYVSRLHAENILRFDGGKGEQSGQLAWDIGGVRVTAELDLLHATPSPELLRDVDYKSGWKYHSVGDVSESFQFQFHAVLVLENYPDINALEVCVWNSRSNRLTPRVLFYRDKLAQYTARINAAIATWYQESGKAPELTETWPDVYRCSICPAATLCPASGSAADLARDPAAFLGAMVAVESRLTAMQKLATAWVDEYGEIEGPQGLRFGRQKPATERKKQAGIYQVKGESNGDTEDNGG